VLYSNPIGTHLISVIDVGVDILPLIRRTAAGRDVDAVDQLRRLLAEDGLTVADVGLEVAVDLHERPVVEGIQASVVPVALTFVAMDCRTYAEVICVFSIITLVRLGKSIFT